MVYNYIDEFNEKPSDTLEVTPKLGTLFLKNVVSSFGLLIFLFVFLFVSYFSLGEEMFLDLFEMVGVSTSFFNLAFFAFIGVAIISVVFLALNHMSVKDLKYVFDADKLTVTKTSNLIFLDTVEIPYENIVRLGYNDEGFFNKLFKFGTVTVELTGMRESKVELEYVFDIEETVPQMQNFLRESLAKKQADFTENYRIDNILNKKF